MSMERYGTATNDYAPLYTLGVNFDADASCLYAFWYKYNSVEPTSSLAAFVSMFDSGVRLNDANAYNQVQHEVSVDRFQHEVNGSGQHSGDAAVTSTLLEDGGWHLVGAHHEALDGTSKPITVYADGAVASSVNRSAAATTVNHTRVCVAGRGYSGSGTAQNENGLFADLGIWVGIGNKAAADALIAELWNSGSDFVRAKNATTTPDYAWDLVGNGNASVGGVNFTVQGLGDYADWVAGDNPAFVGEGSTAVPVYTHHQRAHNRAL